jgi:L-2-hydroxycarboxylate dehydrogenase (NAD+)
MSIECKGELIMRLPTKTVQRFIKQILMRHDVGEYDAKIAAKVMIEGDKRGYKTHGVNRIFQVLVGLQESVIKPRAEVTVMQDTNSITLFDAHFGLGYSIAEKAMFNSIYKATKSGVGISGVINSSHIGILSYYAEIAAKKNCIGIVLSTSSPAVVLKGGKIKTLGTNPLSFSLPLGLTKLPVITADFSTSKVSMGKLYEYIEKASEIPLGWAVDEHGVNTTCPIKALKGGLCTLDNDFKGFLISFLISILAGPLIGGVINPKVKKTRSGCEKPNKGDLFLALHIPHFTDLSDFINKMQDFVSFIREQKSNIKIPGERALQECLISKSKGIEISSNIIKLFKDYSII